MSRRLLLFTFVLMLIEGTAQAGPLAGRYAGVLTITKKVDGLAVTTSIQTQARVSVGGRLTIVAAIPESPLPQTQGAGAQAGETVLARNVLQTTIEVNNTCIVPGSRIPPTLPPGTVLTGDLPVYIPYVAPSPFSGYYTHLGQIRTEGTRFYLSYADVAREHITVNPPPVPPPSVTEFSYIFRRIGD